MTTETRPSFYPIVTYRDAQGAIDLLHEAFGSRSSSPRPARTARSCTPS
jgi:hypothetical protein